MQGKDFTTSISVKQSPAEVYAAINNVRGWWQGEIIGSNDQVKDEFSYQMETFHFSKQQVTALVPGKRIEWLVTESNLSFANPTDEWTGTHIIFEIKESEGNTEVIFTHKGLVSSFDCYDACSGGWTSLLQKSLLSLITTGKGKKVF